MNELGIPAVVVGTKPFVRLARFGAEAAGLRSPRLLLLEHPLAGLNAEQVVARVEAGLAGLTAVLGPIAEGGSATRLRLATAEVPDDPVAFSEYLADAGISDGLPAVPPTPARVAAMLAMVEEDPHAVVAEIPPRNAPVTVEMIAICAVMAGCLPAHLPVVLACARALARPPLNAQGMLCTTGTATFATIVNGPVRAELGFNAATNCLGPGNRSNATVGRALSIVTQVLGGATIGLNSMPTMGQPGRFTFCFAENEEQSPWAPLHVERGFDRGESTVTLIGVSGTQEVTNGYGRSPEELLDLTAAAMAGPGAIRPVSATCGGGRPLLLLSPEWVTAFAARGWSKDDVKRYLYERATFPIERLPAGMIEEIRRCRPGKDDAVLTVAAAAEDILVVVAGGVGIKQTYVPNWIGMSEPVTVPIATRAVP